MGFFREKETKETTEEKDQKKQATLLEHDKVPVDEKFFSTIAPAGGISFQDEKFIKVGDGYEACIYVYQYPTQVPENWLADIMNQKNVISEVDISNEDMNRIRRHINKSVKEYRSRYRDTKNATESADSVHRIQELNTLYDQVISGGEIIKLITSRVFVCGRTLKELDEKVQEVTDFLESKGYKAAVNINENRYNWTSMYYSYTKQMDSRYSRYGQPLTTQALAGGNPFHFTSLSDPMGSYFGWTDTSGTILFDMFHRSKLRMSYNAIAVGSMGAGKSTTLKKILKDRAIRGDFVRCFDATGEYKTLVTNLGGRIISLDGTAGILNALEILKTDESESMCFARHLSKLSTFYKIMSPTSDSYEVMAFEQLIRQFYVKWGIVSDDDPEKQVTGLGSENYPIWSDFLDYVDGIVKNAKSTDDYVKDKVKNTQVQRYDNIRQVIYNIVKNYGSLFDGHTSIEDILHTQVVCYNIATLKNLKTEVFDAQIFLAQSQWWDNCVRLGSEQKHLFETHQIKEEDIVHFLGIIDEAHTMVNANKTVTLDQLIVFCREARKFFGGLIFASQSIRDFVPEGANAISVDKIKTLFELTQYKFIMRQDSNSVDTLDNVFSHQLTESELSEIPRLEKGECILAISGDRNIRCHVYVNQEELDMFSGGA